MCSYLLWFRDTWPHWTPSEDIKPHLFARLRDLSQMYQIDTRYKQKWWSNIQYQKSSMCILERADDRNRPGLSKEAAQPMWHNTEYAPVRTWFTTIFFAMRRSHRWFGNITSKPWHMQYSEQRRAIWVKHTLRMLYCGSTSSRYCPKAKSVKPACVNRHIWTKVWSQKDCQRGASACLSRTRKKSKFHTFVGTTSFQKC